MNARITMDQLFSALSRNPEPNEEVQESNEQKVMERRPQARGRSGTNIPEPKKETKAEEAAAAERHQRGNERGAERGTPTKR